MYGNEDRRFTHDEDALISTVSAVQAKDITSLHKAILESVWTCSIAGDTTTVQKVSNVIKKTKSKYKRLREQTGHHQQKPPNATLAIRDIPSRQNIDFSIGIPVPITLHHPDFAALNFGLAVLGKWGGFTGRLMSTVREQEGLTYGIYARTESFYGSEQGYWRIMTFFSPVQAILGLTSTYREITTLYRDGITESELIRFKNILATGQALLQDSPLSQLRDLHAYHQQGLNLQEIAEHKSKLHSLTLEEVNTAIKTYCDPSLLTISAAGPINKKMATELKTFLKSVS
jgi:zinc protease